MSEPVSINVMMKTIGGFQGAGWEARLYELKKGYVVLSNSQPFGRLSYIVRRGDVRLSLLQGARTGVVSTIENLTPEMASVIRDLLAVGALYDLNPADKAIIYEMAPLAAPKVYEFGCAPKARADGYSVFATIAKGTTESVRADYAGQDVAIVAGASLYDEPGQSEFGVFRRAAC